MCLVSLMESRDGVVVIALPSHLHGPGSGPKWVNLVACFILFPRVRVKRRFLGRV